MVPGRNGSVGLFHQHLTVGFLLYIYIYIYIYIVDMKVSDWLVVWNMAFIFHIYVYIGNHHPN